MFLTESIESNEKGGGGGGSLAEILVEAEVSYGNLVQRMMTLEHKAIITEDVKLLESSISGFWETFKAWLAKWWAKIKDFFFNLWDRIARVFTSDEKWIADLKKRGVTFGKVEEIKVYSKAHEASKNLSTVYNEVEKLAKLTTAKDGGEGQVAALRSGFLTSIKQGSAESVHEAVLAAVLGESEEKTNVDSNLYVTELLELAKLAKASKGSTLKTIETAVKAAEKTASDKTTKSEKAAVIRAALSLVSTALGSCSTAFGFARSACRSVINAGISADRKKTTKDIHGESALFEGVL